MSSFYVQHGCIDDAVTAYNPNFKAGDFRADDLGRGMLRMNRDAVADRYELSVDSEEYQAMTEDAEGYEYQEPETSETQQFKSLSCLTYQCSEGEVPHRLLFIDLIQKEKALKEKLWPYTGAGLYDIPAYAEAAWNRSRA